ncbi:MAG TPA: TonB-dependent receptor [Gammaproteobacteria bacterium]|nr:TonB-dependent receptor [Gammaproteobacteria bacterium]
MMFVAPTAPASAQDEQAEGLQETVVVTGSRIPRRDFTANAPIMTVDEQLFEETSNIGVETILNQMPQFVPAITQFTTTDVQQTALNTVGASTVSLRGLGANRNLVLINGRRAMPVNSTMVVDTNSIPSSAVARVEVISGGASAVYGADAVGGVVNFVLKDDYEGASVDIRFGDTQHGGSQTVTVSGLIGANMAGDRGNVMLGVERSTRGLEWAHERDWRIEDAAKPNTGATAFFWGTDAWVSNEQGTGFFANNPPQAAVDALFDQAAPGAVPNTVQGTRFLVNDDGTLYTGLMQSSGAAGSYRYNGPLFGDVEGNFPGLPFRVYQPNGQIKENNWWNWESTPLERLSAFANGHFDLSDNVRLTAQAMVTRTQTQTQLGLSADTITIWGAAVPFGDQLYQGGPVTTTGNGTSFSAGPDDSCAEYDGGGNCVLTNSAYTISGRYGVECDAPATAEKPWLDGLPGCTNSEAWPTSPEIYNLFMQRPDPDAPLWANRPPSYLRDALGGGRSSSNTLTTMNFSLGLEGELPSGNDFWDITLSTGRTDNLIIQRGSVRLGTYRALMAFPNYGRNALFDPNPYVVGFAESTPVCTSGLAIFDNRDVTEDCATMIAPDLKNQNEVTQTILEANLVGDLVEMPAGALQYALGLAYRENSYQFSPDNLSDNQNLIDPIAGLFPNARSGGEFDVAEIYGELLIPIVSGGPAGVEHFNVELGARVSDWSMPQMPNLETYKALIDWAITPRYRIRGGFNRAFRAPNLGELFSARTQVFGLGGTTFGDHCSQNMTNPASYSATAGGGASAQQVAQALSICRALMGTSGAFEYYDNRPLLDQPQVGGLGTGNSIGQINLREERADTFTIGTVMDFHDNFTLTVDWYEIEIEDMIALESGDSVYARCLSLEFNPTGDPNHPNCVPIFRNPSTGNGANVDLPFTNEGRALMSGVDLQLNWSRPLANGGFNMNMVGNINLEAITQDRPGLDEIDHSGFNSCALQIQCQRYDYRLFTTYGYSRGQWNVSLRHQHWPELDNGGCRTNPTGTGCLYSSLPDYDLFALSFRYSFDRYTLGLGIENLLDTDPPCTGGNPTASPFPTACTRTGNSVFDPLGRQYFLSMNMEF